MSIEIENMNVWQRFHGVMSDISYIKKEREVTQGARFKYVGHDEVAAKIHVALVKWRLVLQTVTSGDIEDGPHEFRNAKGSRFERRCEVHVTLRFVNIDKPEEVIEMGPFVAASFDSSDKASGKAYSYAMKTALLKAFVLESGERDNEDAEPMEPVSPQAQDRLGGFLNHAEGLSTRRISSWSRLGTKRSSPSRRRRSERPAALSSRRSVWPTRWGWPPTPSWARSTRSSLAGATPRC